MCVPVFVEDPPPVSKPQASAQSRGPSRQVHDRFRSCFRDRLLGGLLRACRRLGAGTLGAEAARRPLARGPARRDTSRHWSFCRGSSGGTFGRGMPRLIRPTTPVLQLTGLTVFRGQTTILSDVNWTVESGQHWVILGSNGSGKTSLLAALTAYLTPSGGTIDLLGERYGRANWPALRRRVGLVSSALRQLLHEEEPAIEIVIGGRRAEIDVRDRPRPADVRGARKLLETVGARHLADRPWGVLSQGERQRVLIARALMARPDLLILDEPCAGLDPVARERFLLFLTELGRSPSPSLVLVTHHVEEIVPVFAHALVLQAGRVAVAGPTREVVTSGVLSEAFEARVRVTVRKGHYSLALEENGV